MTAAEQQKFEDFDDASVILREVLPGYEVRPQQAKMAKAIEITLAAEWDEKTGLPPTLAVQAGCGTGKSYGMLIPAAQSDRRVVFCTSTIALQRQVIDKDLPFLAKHLPNFPDYALLMGRGNYLCAAKLAEGPDVPQLTELQAAQADEANEGTRDSIDVEITGEQWAKVSSTGSECPGAKQCPFADQCKSEAAKKKAAEAKLVVTNAACLGMDMVLSEEMETSSGPMLGDYDALFCDEADGLDSALRGVLATTLNERGLMMLADRAQGFVKTHGEMNGDTLKESVALVKAVQGFSATLPKIIDRDKPNDDPKGDDLDQIWFAEHTEPVQTLISALDAVSAVLRKVSVDGLDLKAKNNKRMLVAQADNASKALREALRADDGEMARFNTWNVVRAKGARGEAFFVVEFHPVAIADRLRENLWSKQPTILTSATLTTAPGDFSYFTGILGLEHAATLDVGTPFDYASQAMMFVPDPSVPAPLQETKAAWTAYAINKTFELVKTSGGGALLLYTARDDMIGAHQVLASRLEKLGLTVLIQDGTIPTGELARRFREDRNAVLFGLKSFFVGLDVPGDSLRLVVMNKLPFPRHTEPVFKARSIALERAGRNAFANLSMPMMTLDLTQAIGRLIRTKQDRGVVAILDSRLTSKSYGKRILDGLPGCPVEVEEGKVEAFFEAMAA